MSGGYHRPVMVAEVLEWLALSPDDVVVDLTAGGGGHSAAILSQLGANGKVYGVDRDSEAIAQVQERLGSDPRFCALRADFESFRDVLAQHGQVGFGKALMDLGVSSRQLDEGSRGFSFLHDGPLDMRMDDRCSQTAADLVEQLPERELTRLLRDYGEERFAGRVARAIVAERRRSPIRTTGRLAEVVARALPPRGSQPIHPATRTFQALRIAVNRELEQLTTGLEEVLQGLTPGGRLVVLSYHSLEDRIVKRAFRKAAGECTCPRDFPVCRCGARRRVKILTSRPVRPADKEIHDNPRARSARLRAVEKVAA